MDISTGLPVPPFDRECMRKALSVKFGKHGKPLSDYEMDLVVYDTIVYSVKQNKRLILQFAISDTSYHPVLSDEITDIRERHKVCFPICQRLVKEAGVDWNEAMVKLLLGWSRKRYLR